MKVYGSIFFASMAMIALGKTGAQRQIKGLSAHKPDTNLKKADEPVGIFNAEGQKLVIIKFRETPGVPAEKFKDMKTSSEKCEKVVAAHGGTIFQVYAKVFSGCAIYLPNAMSTINALNNNLDIEYFEDDRIISVDPTTTSEEATSWGLDRIDQCALPLDGKQTPLNATHVKVYILDTGIQGTHDDFEGVIDSNANCHVDTTVEGTPLVDGHGHGTHVASTACGNEYGVARGCNLCSVKILEASGSGTWAGVIAGVEHVMSNCADGESCVANMSIGGGLFQPLNDAVAEAVNSGVTFVVAAGNSNDDSCEYSPASEPFAITVGSTKIGDSETSDTRSEFSNFGSCVNAFAPGSDITAAWNCGNSCTNTISGTSMASPHVAGLAAGILFGNRAFTPAQVLTEIQESFTGPVIDSKTLGVGLATTDSSCTFETLSPTTMSPSTSPTLCPDEYLEIHLLTDNFPYETSWTLTNKCSGEIQASVDAGHYQGAFTANTDLYCIPEDQQYEFEIFDSFGDGICCNGGVGRYRLKLKGEVVASGAEFGSSEVATFGKCPPCTGDLIDIVVLTDNWPGDTAWTLKNQGTGEIKASVLAGDYTEGNSEKSHSYCFTEDDQKYEFEITDEFEDGICCFEGDGRYQVSLNGVIVSSGGEFGSSETSTFGSSTKAKSRKDMNDKGLFR